MPIQQNKTLLQNYLMTVPRQIKIRQIISEQSSVSSPLASSRNWVKVIKVREIAYEESSFCCYCQCID